MTRVTVWLLVGGTLLFVGVLVSQGMAAVAATLARAGWGLPLVAAFHLLPLALDAAAIRVLFAPVPAKGSWRSALLARWVGESANSLLPAGQLGGPVLMARHLAGRGVGLPDAAAAVTVGVTLQALAQIVFALLGVALLGARTGIVSPSTQRLAALIASAVLVLQVGGFYVFQRRGLFARLLRAAARFRGPRDWSHLMIQAEAIDTAVQAVYVRAGAVAASFLLNLVGWLAGTGETFLIAMLLGFPLSWSDALLLESLGQAVRGAAFAIPGALGVQEGGYLLLAPLVGLPADASVALSLAKRARELLLGVPGLLYLQFAKKIPLAASRLKA